MRPEEPRPQPPGAAPGVAPTLTVYALHALGSSGAEFRAVADALGTDIRLVPIDLPGFGDARDEPGRTVSEMADAAIARIHRDGAPRWLLLGHSMGGKVASVIARRALDGHDPVFGLAGVVLLAASPPTPEPMSEDKRDEMTGWADDGALSEAQARAFIEANAAVPLCRECDARAIDDLRRAAPSAWVHWLEHGSREDVSPTVGTLDIPALILAGEDDDDLGADAQPHLHGSVYPRARFVRLRETGHLIPQERPGIVATAIAALRDEIDAHAPVIPADWAHLIASPAVAPRVRSTLAHRAIADDPAYRPRALTAPQLDTLRRLADLVVPQPARGAEAGDGGRIDLAARVDAQLADGEGDGWRPADLPPDAVAAGLALDALAGVDLDADLVDALVGGRLAPAGSPLSPAQLQAWAEDARVDLVRHWLAHPASLARTGNDSFATRGVPEPRGFTVLAPGRREQWEPESLGALPAPLLDDGTDDS